MRFEKNGAFSKTFVALCAATAMFFLQVPKVSAQSADNTPKLTAEVSSVSEEKTVSVSVSLSENSGLWGLKFKLGYDHSALKLDSVKAGKVFSENEIVKPEKLDAEKYVFFACKNDTEGDIATNGVIATFNFSLTSDAQPKEYPISLELTQAINNTKSEVKMATVNGAVKVSAPAPNPDPAPNPEPDSTTASDKVAGDASPSTASGQELPLMALLTFIGAGAATASFLIRRKK